MDNFLLGMQAVLTEARAMLARLSGYPMLWGFAAGFFTSTLFHAFLMTGKPSQLSTVLFKSKGESFQKLYPPDADGKFTRSYAEYSHMVERTKITMLTGFLCVTVILLLVSISR